MRRVPLNKVTKDMVLARAIYSNGNLILAKETGDLYKHIDKLNNYGIYSVYIEDDLSEDIVIEDDICDETRHKCKKLLSDCVYTIINQGRIENGVIDDMINSVLDDLLNREDVVVGLADISVKDEATLSHSVSTMVHSVLCGKRMGFKKEEIRELAEGALFHDFGKLLIDTAILQKKGKLTDEEFENIKEHPVLGYDVLCKYSDISNNAKIIALQHHERLDGSGYPKGIKSEDITTYSKIVAISDVYDALTAERCYRKSMSNKEAYEIIISDVGSKFDKEIFEMFMMNVAVYPNGTVVNLTNGMHGIVKKQVKNHPLRPLVRVVDDRDKNNIKLFDLDLSESDNINIIEK